MPQTYAEGLGALRGDPPANPRPPLRRRRAPRNAAEETPGERPIPPPRRRRAPHNAAEETPGERPIPPPRRRRAPRATAEERPTAPSTDQDGAVERLVSLFLAGAITPQTYVNGLRALAPRLHRPPFRLPAGEGLSQPRAPRPRKVSSPAIEGFSQFHPSRASYPAGEGFSQFHPARASSPAGEGLSRTCNSWRFTGLAGPLGYSCAVSRWTCLKATPKVQTLELSWKVCGRRFRPNSRKRLRL